MSLWITDMRLIGLLVLFCSSCSLVNEECNSLASNQAGWKDLQEKWADEQIIMILRHTAKCKDEPGCIDNDEFLTDKGRQQAVDISTGLHRTLGGKYLSFHSSMTRTRDTALLAFGNSNPDDGISKPCLPGFNTHVHELPIATNTILVTHSSCIDSLTNVDEKRYLGFKSGKDRHFGVAAFFEQHKPDGLRLHGCVWPGDWSHLPDA